MEFEIKKVLDLKVMSIPMGKDKEGISIKKLNDMDSRKILYSLLTTCFDKTKTGVYFFNEKRGMKKGVLEPNEQESLFNEVGNEISKRCLSDLVMKFKLSIFPHRQTKLQINKEAEQRVKELIGKLKNDHLSWETRKDAGLELGYILSDILADVEISPDTAEAVASALIIALGDKNKEVRCAAAWTLSFISPVRTDVLNALINTLGDKNEDVRYFASEACSRIGSTAMPALIKKLNNKNWKVRYHAVEALARMRYNAVEAVPALVTVLSDENWNVRENAAKALGDILDGVSAKYHYMAKIAVPALEKMIKDKWEWPHVKARARKALKKIEGK